MPLEDALAKVPFLGGYLGQQQFEQQQQAGQLGQMGALMKIKAAMDAQKQEAAFRAGMPAIQALPEDQRQQALADLAAQNSPAKDVLAREQASLDRKAQIAATREAVAGRLEQAKSNAEMMHEFRMSRAQNDQQRLEETARHNKQMEELGNQYKALGLELRTQGLNLRREQFDNTQEQQLQGQTTKFANTLQQNKVPQLSASMTAANDLLKKYEGGSIPGFGAVSGSSSVPNLMRSAEANNVRSAVQSVTNDLLNMYSGLAVTIPESERRSLEQMNRGDFTEADFRNAWPRVVSRFNSVMGSLKAGANPKAIEKYQSQPGAIRLEPIAPAFSAASAPNGVDPKIWSVMTPEEKALWKK